MSSSESGSASSVALPVPRPVSRAMRPLVGPAECGAQIDVLARQQQYGAIGRLCDAVLGDSAAHHGPASRELLFWRAFSSAHGGDAPSALRDLSRLEEAASAAGLSQQDLALPVTALSYQIHAHAKKKDETLLASLKSRLRESSKQQTSADSMMLASRYFLFTGRAEKARQCLGRVSGRSRRREEDTELLNLLAMADLRASMESADTAAAESTALFERSRKIVRKAIKLASVESDSRAAAASSDGATATPATASSPSLLVSMYTRISQIEHSGDLPKALREADRAVALFPDSLIACEWKARLMAATAAHTRCAEWTSCVTYCERQRQELRSAAKATSVKDGPSLTSGHAEHDSACLRWLIALDALLTSPSLTAGSVAYGKVDAFATTLLSLECNDYHALSSAARTLISLSRGVDAILDVASRLASRAALVQRRCFPSSQHEEASRLLCLQGDVHLASHAPDAAAAALECFLEALVMDETAEAPPIGQADALLRLRRFSEARQALNEADTAAVIAKASRDHASGEASQQDDSAMFASRRALLRAGLAWEADADAEQAMRHLAEVIGEHARLAQSQVRAASSWWDRVFNADSFLFLSKAAVATTSHLERAGRLFLGILGDAWRRADHTMTREETHAAHVLEPLIRALENLLVGTPASTTSRLLLAQLTCVQRNYTACREHVRQCETLIHHSKNDASLASLMREVAAIKRHLDEAAGDQNKTILHTRRPSSPAPASTVPSEPASTRTLFTRSALPQESPAHTQDLVRAAPLRSEDAEDDFPGDLLIDLDSDSDGDLDAAARRRRSEVASTRTDTLSAQELDVQRQADIDAEVEFAVVAARAAAGGALVRLEQSRANKSRPLPRDREAAIAARAEAEAREALDVRSSTRKASREASFARERDRDLAHSWSGSSLSGLSSSRASSTASLHAVPYLAQFAANTHATCSPHSSPAPVLGSSSSEKTVGSASTAPPPMASSASLDNLERPPKTPSTTRPTPLRTSFDGGFSIFRMPLTPASAGTTAPGTSPSTPSSRNAAGPTRSLEGALLASKKHAAAVHVASVLAAERFAVVCGVGASFWKHGRKGAPHQRVVRVTCVAGVDEDASDDELRFDWGTGSLSVRREEFRLVTGKQTEVLQRATAARTRPDLCFSIIAQNRTLDLEATSTDLLRVWVDGLRNLVAYFPRTTGVINATEVAAAGTGVEDDRAQLPTDSPAAGDPCRRLAYALDREPASPAPSLSPTSFFGSPARQKTPVASPSRSKR